MHVRYTVWATVGLISVAAFTLQALAQTVPFDKRQKWPDLVVQSVRFLGNPIRDRTGIPMSVSGALMGTCNKVLVTIRNASLIKIAKPFVVTVYLGKKRKRGYRYYTGTKHRKTINRIAARRSVTLLFDNFKVTGALKTQKVYVVAKVDTTRQVREANEKNNQKGFRLRRDLGDWTRPCP